MWEYWRYAYIDAGVVAASRTLALGPLLLLLLASSCCRCLGNSQRLLLLPIPSAGYAATGRTILSDVCGC